MEYMHVGIIDFAHNVNERVFGIFLAQDVDVRVQNDGKTKYITLTMVDKDFKINAKRFGASEEEIEKMKNGGVYYAAIDVKPYKKDPSGYSCILYNFDVFDESPANFVQWADGMQEAFKVIESTLAVLSQSIYGPLINNLIQQNWQKISVWAAATGLHHNMPGGLMVHTSEVIRQAEVTADLWNKIYGEKFINKDLLLSAALLHDIAKVKELNVDTTNGSVEYSTKSALETHITMCVSMIEIESYKLGLGYEVEGKTPEQVSKEQEALALLKHCILAHHGQKQYGSPIDMNCPEAYILNSADCISAEMFRYNKNFKSMGAGTSSSVWVSGNISVTYKDTSK